MQAEQSIVYNVFTQKKLRRFWTCRHREQSFSCLIYCLSVSENEGDMGTLTLPQNTRRRWLLSCSLCCSAPFRRLQNPALLPADWFRKKWASIKKSLHLWFFFWSLLPFPCLYVWLHQAIKRYGEIRKGNASHGSDAFRYIRSNGSCPFVPATAASCWYSSGVEAKGQTSSLLSVDA